MRQRSRPLWITPWPVIGKANWVQEPVAGFRLLYPQAPIPILTRLMRLPQPAGMLVGFQPLKISLQRKSSHKQATFRLEESTLDGWTPKRTSIDRPATIMVLWINKIKLLQRALIMEVVLYGLARNAELEIRKSLATSRTLAGSTVN